LVTTVTLLNSRQMCWIQVHVATYKHTTYEYCVYMYTFIHAIRSCILCMRLYVLSYIQFVNMYYIIYPYMIHDIQYSERFFTARAVEFWGHDGEHLEVKEAQRLVMKRNWVWGLPSLCSNGRMEPERLETS
jgi:hypothetical protein